MDFEIFKKIFELFKESNLISLEFSLKKVNIIGLEVRQVNNYFEVLRYFQEMIYC